MKKLFFAMTFVAVTALLSSCSKEKPVTPLVDQLATQSNYQIKSVTLNTLDITNYALENVVGGSIETKGFLEIHVNDAAANSSNLSSSRMFVSHGNSRPDVPLVVTKTNSSSAVTLVFNEENPAFVGSQGAQNTPQIPYALFQNNMIQSRCDGNCWYLFSRNKLSGTYKIEATTDGFRLTCKNADNTIIWDLAKI